MLPDKFPEGTKFFDVEDVPVADIPTPEGGSGFWAFDPDKRRFPGESVYRNGMMVRESAFREMVVREEEARAQAGS